MFNMTSEHGICSLCYDTVEEKDGVIIDENLRGMIQTVIIGIDLRTNAHSVICKKCHEKLEAYYNFNRKCICTESSITPFVSENVKLDLKDVYNQIIKSEDIENGKNVCRVCLQLVDYEMILSDNEKEEFRRFFPQIDLSCTNFVILCSTCYDLLHEYFIFVTFCLKLEQQNWENLDQIETKIDIIEEPVCIKLEQFENSIKTIKEEDEGKMKLHEELDIKCDSLDERCDRNNQEIEQLALMKPDTDTLLKTSINEQGEDINKFDGQDSDVNLGATVPCFKSNNEIESKNCYLCEYCGKNITSRDNLKRHIVNMHRDPSKIPWHQCEHCDKKFKHKYTLKCHVLRMHIDKSNIDWHKCEYCDKKFKLKIYLKRHMLGMHTDPSKIPRYQSNIIWHKCKHCDKKFNLKVNLKRHILCIHTDPSKIPWYQCEQCDKKFKQKSTLTCHVLWMHTDKSSVIWRHCEHCDKKFRSKACLKRHILLNHTDPSKIFRYQCEQCILCNQYKNKKLLIRHILDVHVDPSKTIWHKCQQCDRKFNRKSSLKSHVLRIHTDSSNITWYPCEQCNKKFKTKQSLNSHLRIMHQITSYKCQQCVKKFKCKKYLKMHVKRIHGESSDI